MAGQLLRLLLLLMSLAYSSSMDPTSVDLGNNIPVYSTTSDKGAALIKTSTEGLVMSHAITKKSQVNLGQEASPTAERAVEASTLTTDVMTSKSSTGREPPPTASSFGPDSGLVTHSTTVSLTSHEVDNKNDSEVITSSQPSDETVGTPKAEPTQGPQITQMKPKLSDEKQKQQLILILVCIVILILILITVLIIMVRSKRRRRSQSFSTRSRRSTKQDAWAGQVPELEEGKMTPHPVAMENGKAGNKAEPGTEQEMSTFISGEKKDGSMVEMNELAKGEALDEKKPLLEETSQASEEAEKSPGEEKIPAQTAGPDLL